LLHTVLVVPTNPCIAFTFETRLLFFQALVVAVALTAKFGFGWAACEDDVIALSNMMNNGECDVPNKTRTTVWSHAKVCKTIHGTYEPDPGTAHNCHTVSQRVLSCTPSKLQALTVTAYNWWGKNLTHADNITDRFAEIRQSCAGRAACMVGFGGIQAPPCFGGKGPDMNMRTAGNKCSAPICSDRCIHKLQIIAGSCYGATGTDRVKGEAKNRGQALGMLRFCNVTPATTRPTKLATGACMPPRRGSIGTASGANVLKSSFPCSPCSLRFRMRRRVHC